MSRFLHVNGYTSPHPPTTAMDFLLQMCAIQPSAVDILWSGDGGNDGEESEYSIGRWESGSDFSYEDDPPRNGDVDDGIEKQAELVAAAAAAAVAKATAGGGPMSMVDKI